MSSFLKELTNLQVRSSFSDHQAKHPNLTLPITGEARLTSALFGKILPLDSKK